MLKGSFLEFKGLLTVGFLEKALEKELLEEPTEVLRFGISIPGDSESSRLTLFAHKPSGICQRDVAPINPNMTLI